MHSVLKRMSLFSFFKQDFILLNTTFSKKPVIELKYRFVFHRISAVDIHIEKKI